MAKKAALWRYIAAILVVAVIGTTGFFLGEKAENARNQTEQQRFHQINLSELDALTQLDGPIYVTGHKSPDMDTVGSSIAYAALLQMLGYDAYPVVLGDINNETKYILEAAGLEVPTLLEDASGQNMILMDHSEYSQSADNLQDANVVSIIDHHGAGSVTTKNALVYDARPLGSTATIVWLRYRAYGMEPTRTVSCAMVGAILSDTSNLQSGTTTYADREALKELSRLAGIEDTDALYAIMYKESISYKGMTDSEIFFSDYKEYESGGRRYAIGCVNAYDEEGAMDLAQRMAKIFPDALTSGGVDMAFAQISILHDGLSVTHLVPSDETAKKVLEAAFGDKAVYNGVSFRMEPGISRKAGTVPAITEVLEQSPRE